MSPKVQYDPREIPSWRKPPRRLEYPVTAFRAWKLKPITTALSGPRYKVIDAFLASVAYSEVLWPGPVLEADIRPSDIDLYYETNRNATTFNSGIYAVNNAFRVRREVIPDYRAPVWGKVHLWGRVVRHELGYRAEYCMILRIVVLVHKLGRLSNPANVEELRDALMRRYQCDVKLVGRMKGDLK
ncbi:MAG: hypothetical protein GTO63_30155 [Anaerolineae bacterium]|nr:hypothetical protein [Anaerolineae bacterium]NIN98969.1 hypothetical protein [Anaerolineae bacterium]